MAIKLAPKRPKSSAPPTEPVEEPQQQPNRESMAELRLVLDEFDPDFWLKKKFLEGLLKFGTRTSAARVAGVTPQMARGWLDTDQLFKAAYADALEFLADDLEEYAVLRAKAGSDPLMIMMLKALRPEKYKEVKRVENTGADGGAILWDATVSTARDILSSKLSEMSKRRLASGETIPPVQSP